MSYPVYKVLHLLGILTVFTALGGAAVLALREKSGTDAAEDRPVRKVLMMLHGVGLVVIVVAGFGLMARKGIGHGGDLPAWIYGKAAIWLALGAAVGFIRRSSGKALWWVVALPLLGTLAAWLAVMQPGTNAPS